MDELGKADELGCWLEDGVALGYWLRVGALLGVPLGKRLGASLGSTVFGIPIQCP